MVGSPTQTSICLAGCTAAEHANSGMCGWVGNESTIVRSRSNLTGELARRRAYGEAMVSPQDAIKVVNDAFGRHPGYRALHAKGVLCRGTFTAGAKAAGLTRAAHMQGQPVPALIRFSNGSGKPNQPDFLPQVRGMAVKFSLPDGSRTDISAQTARLFSSRTVEGFLEFVQSAQPGVASFWRLPRFVVRHPEFLRTLPPNAVALKLPASYGSCGYHALHAFQWLDANGGSRYVRYHWLPEAGNAYLSPQTARRLGRDYLTKELTNRLDHDPVRFRLQVQVAGAKDSTTDPSAPWNSKETVTVGTLEVTGMETERESEGGIVVFDPMRVTDGIAPSDDPILHFRTHAYSVSVEQRSGVARGE